MTTRAGEGWRILEKASELAAQGEQFALATELDPNYADAWAQYAYALSLSNPSLLGGCQLHR